MSSRLRVVVVGTGFGARVVAPVFAGLDGVEVVEVVSARDDRAVRTAVQRASVDLVTVHSPPAMHARHVGYALDVGAAVLCDKPLSVGVASSRAMFEAAEAAGVVNLVNYEFRRAAARRRLRDLVREGVIGDVEHVHWLHLTSGSRHPLRRHGWLFEREHGGGWIGAWGSHAIDTLRFAIGEIDAVEMSHPRTDILRRPDAEGVMRDCTAEDGVSAVLRFVGGATVTIDSSFAASATVPARLTVAGSEGVLEVVGDTHMTLRRPDGTREVIDLPAFAPGVDPHLAPMQDYAASIRDLLVGERVDTDLATFADGLAVDIVLDALRAPG